MTTKYRGKEFRTLYDAVMENGNTALKPLAPLPSTRPHLYLVPNANMTEAKKAASCRPHMLSKCILGFVGLACLFTLVSGNGALVWDIAGCGSVAYFATRCLTEE